MDLSAHGPDQTDLSAIAGKLRQATGGAAPHHAWRLLGELAAASGSGAEDGADATDGTDAAADGDSPVLAALEAAMALAPRDPLEGMLAAQMTAVHGAAMRCLARAAACGEHPQIEALYLREAARLLHLFQRQAEMLDRRSRRLGPPQEAGADGRDAAAAGDGGEAAQAAGAPGPHRILETVLEPLVADLRARMRARQGAEGEGDAGNGGGGAGRGRGRDP
jgi:hypothetical protein